MHCDQVDPLSAAEYAHSRSDYAGTHQMLRGDSLLFSDN